MFNTQYANDIKNTLLPITTRADSSSDRTLLLEIGALVGAA